jgi:hypothetical protein
MIRDALARLIVLLASVPGWRIDLQNLDLDPEDTP